MWIFLAITLFIIGVSLFVYSITDDYDCKGLMGILSSYMISTAIVVFTINISEPIPTALDVYRDSTELKITSVNGVPIDTVVVFKNK